eukprot:300951_1
MKSNLFSTISNYNVFRHLSQLFKQKSNRKHLNDFLKDKLFTELELFSRQQTLNGMSLLEFFVIECRYYDILDFQLKDSDKAKKISDIIIRNDFAHIYDFDDVTDVQFPILKQQNNDTDQLQLNECKEHGNDFQTYKCKYCCNIATIVCWGSVHLCAKCATVHVW